MAAWFKTELEKLRPMTGKQRLEYFRMYYLLPVSIAVIALFFAVWGIATGIANSSREVTLYIHLADLTEGNYTQWLHDYETARGYADNQSVKLTQGQYAEGTEALTYSASVYAAAQSLDVLICDDDTLEPIIKMGLAQPIPPVLQTDTAALAQSKLGFVDILKKDTYGDGQEQLTGDYYLDITGTGFAKMLGMDDAYLLVCVSTPRAGEINAFIQYVLTQK